MVSTNGVLGIIFLISAIFLCCLTVQQVCLSPVGLPNLDKLLKYRALIMVIGILHGIEYIFTTIHVFIPRNNTVIFANHLVYVISSFLKSVACYILSTETIEALYRQRKHQEPPPCFATFFKVLIGSFVVSLVITSLLSLATTRMIFWNVHFLYTNVSLSLGCFVVFIALVDVVYFLYRNMRLAQGASSRNLNVEFEGTKSASKSRSKGSKTSKGRSSDSSKSLPTDELTISVKTTFYKLSILALVILGVSIQQAADVPNHIRIIEDHPQASVFDGRFPTTTDFVFEYLKDTLLVTAFIAWLCIPSCELDQYSVCNILCFAELPDEVDGQIIFPPKDAKEGTEEQTYRDTITKNRGSLPSGQEIDSIATRTRKSTTTQPAKREEIEAIPSSDEDEEPIGEESMRVIVYDFDQTITRRHLYSTLGGGRLKALDDFPDDALRKMFGDEDRIADLDKHFEVVKEYATLIVVSRGWAEVIQSALERVGLIRFFEANVEGSDAVDSPEHRLDQLLSESVHDPSQSLGSSVSSGNAQSQAKKYFRIVGKDSPLLQREGDKHGVIARIKEVLELSHKQVLFVDDDQNEIESVAGAQLCETVWVSGGEGLGEDETEQIETWAASVKIQIER